jgi:hypothetical protein
LNIKEIHSAEQNIDRSGPLPGTIGFVKFDGKIALRNRLTGAGTDYNSKPRVLRDSASPGVLTAEDCIGTAIRQYPQTRSKRLDIIPEST